MSAIASDVVCVPTEGSLPEGPFTALRFHFGMLLGVDDFETEQRYLRGKTRLHNAWLHRAGIVWGLGVDVVADKREIRVEPGLAQDGSGRELHLDVRCCMDIAAWYEAHAADVDARTGKAGEVIFDGRVELAFCACGTRPVPAIAGPCEGAEVDTAYSRTFETVAIRFVPELAATPPLPYPRLRALFGLDETPDAVLADRDDVVAARNEVLAGPAEEQALKLLEYFRTFADLDATELVPATSADGEHAVPFPEGDDAVVVLANLRDITLTGAAGARLLVDWALDRRPRRALVATATIQELLCGPALAGGVDLGSDAGGPRVISVEVEADSQTVVVKADRVLDGATVVADAFSVARLTTAGWESIEVVAAGTGGTGSTSLKLQLGSAPGKGLVRIVAKGTGPAPILGVDHVPLAGGTPGPPGGSTQGHDFVFMSTLEG